MQAVLLAEKREACSEKLDHKPAMSQSYQGGASLELAKEHKGSQRIRQVNNLPQVSANETTPEEPPIRHSWRPCQILNQDGELDSPRHHQPPTGRGPHRRRQWHPSGQGQTPGQASDLVLVMSPSKPDCSKSRDSEPNPVHQPRPAVARYRRHGDPNLSLKLHILRQPHREMQNSSPVAKEREGPAEVQVQQHPSADHGIDQSRDRESPYQTPIAVVSPSHHSAGPASADLSFHSGHSSPAEIEECKVEYEKEPDEVKEDDEAQIQKEDVWGHNPTINCSSCGQDDVQMVDTEELAESVEETQEAIIAYIPEKDTAQEIEITDLCSDTESTASLGIDGPPHNPPPLQLPTPPSSPDIPLLTQLVHFTKDTSLSPMPDYDPLPEEEDDEECCSDSYSLSHFTSFSESYPKTYADFFSESHQNSYSEPVNEENSEPELHPQSFPGPFKSSYTNLHRDPRNQSGSRTEPDEGQQEYLQEPHRHENVQNRPPSSCYTSKQGRDRGSFHFPLGRSVGCRLHHYDGRSDGEEDSADQITVPKVLRRVHRQADTQAKIKLTRQSSSGEAQEEQNMAALLGEEDLRGSGDRITVAIKDIKEAIEEFKTKMVRSPYTSAKLVEPIWVMRQEFGPTEDLCPQRTAACHSSPHSPSKLKSPFHCTSVSVREPVSKLRAELTMAHHHSQQGDTAMPQQPYVHIQQQMPLQQVLAQRPRPKLHSLPPQQPTVQEICRSLPQFPTYVDVPGPCDPEDLFDGIIFAATYLECTHLLSERTPTKSARMKQAQEAMSRVRAARKQSKKNKKTSPDNEVPSTVEVDLFMSTQRIKVLNADTQESIIDLPLRTISYIADIGNMVVLMARGKMVRSNSAQENLDQTAEQTSMTHDDRRLYRMICHVFESEDAQLIAQSIGQSFSIAYQEFLRANGIDPADLSQREYSDLLNTQDMYNDDLIHFSKSENCRDVYIKKQKGEILGVVIVESGWGSILPTVIIASMMHAGPAEKSGRLNIGDQIMTINGTSLVGLPLTTCQSIIKGLKSQFGIKMNIVRCPPVTIVLIRRPYLRYQLGFSVQNGIICSLMRGGIAERGGVRVGHRIIEINSQSVVAMPHKKIVQILSNAVGQIHMKTMPAVMYRLLTAQEQPVYI